MARHRKRRHSRKNPRRVRAARRAYRRSGLYKYNKSRKRRGKYSRRRHHAHRRRKHHRKHRKHYKRLSKQEASAARLARKLAHSKRHVVVLPKAELTSSQKSYLEKLRGRAAAAKVNPDWGY